MIVNVGLYSRSGKRTLSCWSGIVQLYAAQVDEQASVEKSLYRGKWQGWEEGSAVGCV